MAQTIFDEFLKNGAPKKKRGRPKGKPNKSCADEIAELAQAPVIMALAQALRWGNPDPVHQKRIRVLLDAVTSSMLDNLEKHYSTGPYKIGGHVECVVEAKNEEEAKQKYVGMINRDMEVSFIESKKL
jgi:hypothetical protein